MRLGRSPSSPPAGFHHSLADFEEKRPASGGVVSRKGFETASKVGPPTAGRHALCPRERAVARGAERSSTARRSADAGLSHGVELALEVLDLVADPGRVLEAEVPGGLVHLLLEGLDQALELLRRHLGVLALPALPGRRRLPPAPAAHALGLHRQEDVGDLLADRLGVDAVFPVVLLLDHA